MSLIRGRSAKVWSPARNASLGPGTAWGETYSVVEISGESVIRKRVRTCSEMS